MEYKIKEYASMGAFVGAIIGFGTSAISVIIGKSYGYKIPEELPFLTMLVGAMLGSCTAIIYNKLVLK